MQPLPGFRDFLPKDCAVRNYIFDRWRHVARQYGFVEWDGPVLEPTELYTKKSGPEIVTQLFNFTDKGEREVALRPELTPTLARVVAAHEREFKKPLKWFSIPQCFRYEKQQRGRLREHFQFNADIIGEASLEADVELISLCIDLLRAFGLNDFAVRISDRAAWKSFLPKLGIAPEQMGDFLGVIDKWDREPEEIISEKLRRFGVSVKDVIAFLAEQNVEWFLPLRERLEARHLQQFCEFNLQIVRGLAYYSGLVFEVFDGARRMRAIAGGGRYDNLIHHLSDGAVSLPAIGFAMGDVVLRDLIDATPEAKKKMEDVIATQQSLDLYVVIAKEERRSEALAEIQALREQGYCVDYSLTAAKVGKQFQTAEQLGAHLAILFGDEWPQLKLKNLRTGDQSLVPNQTLHGAIEQLLGKPAS